MAVDTRTGPFEVVFVCTGNRARSPLAEAFLTALVEPSRVVVSSRGTRDAPPARALPEAVGAGLARGVDLSGHRSAPIVPGELERADLVVGFEAFHVAAAVLDGGAQHARAFTILELAEILERLDRGDLLPPRPEPAAVVVIANGARHGSMLSAPTLPDPYGSSQKEFDRTAETIKRLVATIASGLFAPR